jgi:CubicO group peptidase (beta-lactamase class C family)
VVYLKGFGRRDLGRRDAVDADTLFPMASTTKAITALAVAMLVDDKRVQWDAPVTRYLPRFKMPGDRWTHDVTVRDLLRMTSGLGNPDLLEMRGDVPLSAIIPRVPLMTAASPIRSSFDYSNLSYAIAGEVVAAASGQSYEEFVAERIFRPLGMSRSFSSGFAPAPDANAAMGHFGADLARIPPLSSVFVSAGGARSTARDMSRWLRFLLGRGELDGKRLVSQENFDELLASQVVLPKVEYYPSATLVGSQFQTYGLGWFQQDYRGRRVAMHTGSAPGFAAIAGLMPEAALGVYVFGNAEFGEFRHAVMWKVFDLYTDSPRRDWSAELRALYQDRANQAEAERRTFEATPVAKAAPTLPLAAYAGTYRHPVLGDIQISRSAAGLHMRFGQRPELSLPLDHWTGDTFRARLKPTTFGIDWSSNQLRVVPDAAGVIGHVVWNFQGEQRFDRVQAGSADAGASPTRDRTVSSSWRARTSGLSELSPAR